MSLDVLQAKFDAYKQECAADRLDLVVSIKELRVMLEGKVSFKHFYWIIGILVSIQTAILGYIVLQNKDLWQVTSLVQVDVSSLKGKLEPYEIHYPQ